MVSITVYIKISTQKLSCTSSQLLIKVSSENKETILTGDFNFNYQKVDGNGELKSICTLFQLKQIIKTATKVTDKTGSLIHSVFTNVPFNITMSGIYALSFSDRDLIGFNRKQNRVKTTAKTIRCRNYRRYDHNKLKGDLKNADWSPVYISYSISHSSHGFNRILTESFDRHVPFPTKRTNSNTSSWLTVDLKNKMGCRNVLQRKFRKSKTTKNYEK